jgi:hypothetical protein
VQTHNPDLTYAVIIATKRFPDFGKMGKEDRRQIIHAIEAGVAKGRKLERDRLAKEITVLFEPVVNVPAPATAPAA